MSFGGEDRIHSFTLALYSLPPSYWYLFFLLSSMSVSTFAILSIHPSIHPSILSYQEEFQKAPSLCHVDLRLNSTDILGRGLATWLTSGKLYVKRSAFLLTILYGLLPGKCLYLPLHLRQGFLFQTMLDSWILSVSGSLQHLQAAGNPFVLGETS